MELSSCCAADDQRWTHPTPSFLLAVLAAVVPVPKCVRRVITARVSVSLSHLVSRAGNSKAAEAAGSAYYNPSNPHNVYMPMVSGSVVFVTRLI